MTINTTTALNEDNPCTFRAVTANKMRFVWEVTANCNLSCWYCFRTDPEDARGDFSLIRRIAGQFDPLLTDSVLLTGGEPFLLKGIRELLDILTTKNIKVKIATNLTFSSKILKSIPQISGIDISSSIDGADAAEHDLIRGAGSIQKIIENVSYLRSINHPVSGRCVLTEQSIHRVEEIVTTAKTIGFSSLTFSRLTQVPDEYALNIENGYDAALPKQESMDRFMELVPKLRSKYPDFPLRTAGFGVSQSQCATAGHSLAYITAHGILHPCTLYRVTDPDLDLKKQPLASALVRLASIDRSQGRSTCPSLQVDPQVSGSVTELVNITRNTNQGIRHAVGAIVQCGDDILVLHKIKAMGTAHGPKPIQGEWGFPSGGVKPGEDVASALRRELVEEVGIVEFHVVRELPSYGFNFSSEYQRLSGFSSQRTRMFHVVCSNPTDLQPDGTEIDAAVFYPPAKVECMLSHASLRDYLRSIITEGLLMTGDRYEH